jgi:DNA-binding response OmpR family regulator
MRVLVVEDQPHIAAAIEHGLHQEGFTVEVAGTAAARIPDGMR